MSGEKEIEGSINGEILCLVFFLNQRMKYNFSRQKITEIYIYLLLKIIRLLNIFKISYKNIDVNKIILLDIDFFLRKIIFFRKVFPTFLQKRIL